MTQWRNCIASIILDQEINERWPNRHKGPGSEDGTIGDAAHASRDSDHNPWVKDANGIGVVRAKDVDEDLDGNRANGKNDAWALVEPVLQLARAGDVRFIGGGLIIYEGIKYSEPNGWRGVPYKGPNKHDKHPHFSWSRFPKGYDSTKPYGLLKPDHKPTSFEIGDKGEGVAFLMDMLNILASFGCAIDKDTNKAVKTQLSVPKETAKRKTFVFNCLGHEHVERFQRWLKVMWAVNGKKGPAPEIDGIAGPKTLGAIMFWIPIVLKK